MDNKKTFQPEEKNKGLAHKTGDAIERVGQKVSEAGATKTGKAIYNAGDKLEHSRDNKK